MPAFRLPSKQSPKDQNPLVKALMERLTPESESPVNSSVWLGGQLMAPGMPLNVFRSATRMAPESLDQIKDWFFKDDLRYGDNPYRIRPEPPKRDALDVLWDSVMGIGGLGPVSTDYLSRIAGPIVGKLPGLGGLDPSKMPK